MQKQFGKLMHVVYDENGQVIHQRVALLLRNYKESFLRMSKSRKNYRLQADAMRLGKVCNFRNFFENLQAVDEFAGEKLLVRYEDLIVDLSEIVRILNFFGLKYNLTGFDVNQHRLNSLGIYDSQHKSYTKYNLANLDWHQKQVDPEILEALDDFVDNNYREIAYRYLRSGN